MYGLLYEQDFELVKKNEYKVNSMFITDVTNSVCCYETIAECEKVIKEVMQKMSDDCIFHIINNHERLKNCDIYSFNKVKTLSKKDLLKKGKKGGLI